MRPALALLVLLSLISACGTPGTRTVARADLNIIAIDEHFAIVRLKRGQSEADLAQVFLGGRSQLQQILDINASVPKRPGDLVAVPLAPANVTGVYADSYKTLPILCYHQFTNNAQTDHILELRASDFEDQLRYLRDEGYAFLTFAEVADIMAQRRPVPDKAVVLTIDDGYASVYDVAWPLLRKYGAKATLFIYTDFINAGAALTWEQLREMKASGLVDIESHGKSHTSLARTEEDSDSTRYQLRLAGELSGSEAAFIAELGGPPMYLSYPYGNSSPAIAKMLRESGYKLAATVTRGPNGSFVDPYLLHRTMIYDHHTLSDLREFLDNREQRPGR